MKKPKINKKKFPLFCNVGRWLYIVFSPFHSIFYVIPYGWHCDYRFLRSNVDDCVSTIDNSFTLRTWTQQEWRWNGKHRTFKRKCCGLSWFGAHNMVSNNTFVFTLELEKWKWCIMCNQLFHCIAYSMLSVISVVTLCQLRSWMLWNYIQNDWLISHRPMAINWKLNTKILSSLSVDHQTVLFVNRLFTRVSNGFIKNGELYCCRLWWGSVKIKML